MSNFSNPFKKQPTAKEAAKGVKKEVRSSQRELDRELRDIDRREAQLIADIKKQARDGRETSVRVLARNLVQLRSSRERLLKARGTVGSMSAQASAMAASITVADSLQKTSKVMHKMNASAQKSAMSVAAFQKEAERMNMTEEAMGDMLSEAFDDDEERPTPWWARSWPRSASIRRKTSRMRRRRPCPSLKPLRPTTRTSC